MLALSSDLDLSFGGIGKVTTDFAVANDSALNMARQTDGKNQIYKVPVEMIAEGSRPNFPMLPGDEVFVPERAW